MNLPCAVVRDLLPVYAENMVEAETAEYIKEHLAGCPACQKRLEGLAEDNKPLETAAPLQSIKKQLRIRRLRAAALAALAVFIVLLTYYFRQDSPHPIPWKDGLVSVESVENDRLTLRVDSRITRIETQTVTIEDDSEILIVQGMGLPSQQNRPLGGEHNELVFLPVPDRVIYGYRQPQQLLWGEPMEGGVEVLPRLALGYYLFMAAAASAILGLLWLGLRKSRFSGLFRQLFFVPLAYVLGQLLLKGTETISYQLPVDLIMLLLAAAAVYGLLTLGWIEWRSRTK